MNVASAKGQAPAGPRQQDMPGAALEGLRVLVLPSSGVAPEKHYIYRPLEAAKARWNWHIDILCSASTPKEYEKLIAPSGQFFERPTLAEQSLPWEADPVVTAELDNRIRDIELVTGVPTGQVVLAADSKIGRGFVDPVILLNDTQISRRVDGDNLEPYRIVRRLFYFAEQMLDASRPDLVYSYEWAKPWLFTVWLAAQRRGIPCIAVRRSKLRSDHCFMTTDRLMFNTAARTIAAAKRTSSAAVSDAANDYIRSFREQPKMVKYVEAKWMEKAKRTWLNWHIEWARSNLSSVLKALAGRKAWRPVRQASKLYAFNRQILRRWQHRRFTRTFSADQLANLRYVYFPLHKETDLPLNFQAAAWFDQRFTIRLLASVLPNGYRLLVREHRHNYGMRPTTYYEELSRLPNVELIDPYDPQFKYVSHAALIVTENGTSGWEGLLLRRKVLTLSTTFYDGAALVRKLNSTKELGSTLLELLGNSQANDAAEHDRALGHMVDAEFETTFDPQDPQTAIDHFRATITPLLHFENDRSTATLKS